MNPTTMHPDDITGIRALLALQAVLALIVGAMLVATQWPTTSAVAVVLAVYWLLRGLATVGHAYVEPDKWMGKGLVAVLGVAAGVLALQAPLLGLNPIGASIILFLAIQGMLTGSIEVVLGVRDQSVALALLGLTSLMLGLGLSLFSLFPAPVLAWGLGMVAITGGFLAGFAALRLPESRDVTVSLIL